MRLVLALSVAVILSLGLAACEEDPVRSQALRDYLEEGFGGAGNPEFAVSWYSSITDVSVAGGIATIETGFYPDAESEPLANTICHVAKNSGVDGVNGARVNGQGGTTIVSC